MPTSVSWLLVRTRLIDDQMLSLTLKALGMFARRAVAQSLAREFGPQGIHVAHVVVDGLIDTPGLREKMGEDKDEKVCSFSLPMRVHRHLPLPRLSHSVHPL